MNKMDSQQFKNLLIRTKILDDSYPVKGAHVWFPNGLIFKNLVFSKLKSMLKEEGYEEYEFPRLMPGDSLRKIARHIQDFSDRVFWLYQNNKSTDIFLNPTGESGIYPMLNRWIRRSSDLPLRFFQIGNTFRSHNRPYPLINSDEATPLLEVHGVFETKEQANNEFGRALEILRKMHNVLAIPYRIVLRPQWGNNPVSEKNISFESYFPPKDINFSVSVAYFQDQIFSRIFDIEYLKDDGSKENTHQLTFGTNERALAAMLALHKDNYGLRFLPEFAPIQIVIIPIQRIFENCGIEDYTEKLRCKLDARIYVDDNRNRTIKQKVCRWRERGVPIQIAVSAKDVQNRTVKIYRRDAEKPEILSIDDVNKIIPQIFDEIKLCIHKDSEALFKKKIKTAVSRDELINFTQQGDIVRFNYCGKDSCGMQLESSSAGEILGIAIEEEKSQERCIGCSNKATVVGYFSRRAPSP